MKYALAILMLAATAVACAREVSFGRVDQEAVEVSIVSLIATPDRFHGKVVRTEGAFRAEFEGNEICLHLEDLKTYNGKNCVWLHFDNKALGAEHKELSSLNEKHVWIEGVFNKNHNGHRNCCSGSIESVWRVTATPFQTTP
jgi:hypothetical protein